jgi:hypothetical protein
VTEPAAEERCASCGAPRGRAREYCLECGARFLPLRRPLHWIWPSLAALALAAAGGAVAASASGGGGSGPVRTIVATQPLVTAPATTTRPKPRARLEPKKTGGRTLITWPGGVGYTVVLATIPLETGPAAARSQALAALQSGLRDVGVLVSSSYSGLHPGYLVVFSGVYSTLEEAQSALASIRPVFPGAFAHEIAP